MNETGKRRRYVGGHILSWLSVNLINSKTHLQCVFFFGKPILLVIPHVVLCNINQFNCWNILSINPLTIWTDSTSSSLWGRHVAFCHLKIESLLFFFLDNDKKTTCYLHLSKSVLLKADNCKPFDAGGNGLARRSVFMQLRFRLRRCLVSFLSSYFFFCITHGFWFFEKKKVWEDDVNTVVCFCDAFKASSTAWAQTFWYSKTVINDSKIVFYFLCVYSISTWTLFCGGVGQSKRHQTFSCAKTVSFQGIMKLSKLNCSKNTITW